MPKHQAPRSWAITRVTELPARARQHLQKKAYILSRLVIRLHEAGKLPKISFPSAKMLNTLRGIFWQPNLEKHRQDGGMIC